jgi:hypothetical protein
MVNAELTAGVIAAVELREGEDTEVDLSTVFAGGDGTYTYDVVSASPDNVSGSESGGMLTATNDEAYSAGTTIGTVDVTVTATDGVGDMVSAVLTVDVLPALGDLDGTGGPSPANAGIALDYYLLLNTSLTAKQVDAADFDRDADVDANDASEIFQAFFGKDARPAFVSTEVEFGDINNDNNVITVPVMLRGGELSDVGAVRVEAFIDPAIATVKGIETNLGEGWLVKHHVTDDGQFRLGIAGYGEMTPDGVVATITLALADGATQFALAAEGGVNNNPLASIDEVEIAEIPDAFTLDGNYPNPFNPSTTIQFNLPETADVEIQIFDMLGRRVMAIPAQTMQAGAARSIQVNASQLASGSYLYRVIARMDSKTQVEQGRMMLLK